MAMQPIDLQTLFTQMDKVGKNQVQQKEGLQIQAALQQVQSQKKAEEEVKALNETRDMGYGASKIRDENSSPQNPESSEKQNEETNDEEAAGDRKNAFFRDPALGRNIDISG